MLFGNLWYIRSRRVDAMETKWKELWNGRAADISALNTEDVKAAYIQLTR